MKIIKAILLGLLVIYTLGQFVQWNPHPFFGGCDDAWHQVMHVGFLKHWQWGRDIIYTIGPWGFIFGGYMPQTYLLSCAIWAVLAGIWCWMGWVVVRHYIDNFFAAWAGLWFFTAIATVHSFLGTDAIGIGFALMLVLEHFGESDRVVMIILTIAMAFLSLVHISALVLAGVIILIVSLDGWFNRRARCSTGSVFGSRGAMLRAPVELLIYCGWVAFFWMLAWQNPFNFFPWLLGSMQVVGAYGDAMSIVGGAEGSDLVIWFAASGFVMWGLWKHSRNNFQRAALAFIIFTAFKHGFIRHDNHEVWCWSELTMVAMAGIAMAAKKLPQMKVAT